MSQSKFYHYRVRFADEDDAGVNPRHCLPDDTFANTYQEISQSGNTGHLIRFRMVEEGKYQGLVMRTRDESTFLRLRNGNVHYLDEELDGDGAAVNANRDISNFGIIINRSSIDVLIEVGFQTPNIGKLTEHFEESVTYTADLDVQHDTKMDDITEDELTQLLDSDLKKITANFKKNPRDYDDSELNIAESIKRAVPDEYTVNYTLSLERGNSNPQTVRERVSDLFSISTHTAEATLTSIDIPNLMSKLYIKGQIGNRTVEENLTDLTLKEEIDLSYFDFFSRDLGRKLINEIEQNG